MPFEGATSTFSKSTYDDSTTETFISAVLPIIIDIGYIGRSGAPATSIDAMSSPLIITCFPFWVLTALWKKPATLTSITISSSDDETKLSWILTGAFFATPTHSCAESNIVVLNNIATTKNNFLISKIFKIFT